MTCNKLTVTIDLGVTDKTAEKCLRVLDMYLEEHSNKTIVVEQEGKTRVCLIAEVKDDGSD